MSYELRSKLRLNIENSGILVFVAPKLSKETVKYQGSWPDPLDLSQEFVDTEGNVHEPLYEEYPMTVAGKLEVSGSSFTFHFYVRTGTSLLGIVSLSIYLFQCHKTIPILINNQSTTLSLQHDIL